MPLMSQAPPPFPNINKPTVWFISIAVLIGMLLAIMLIIFVARNKRGIASSTSKKEGPVVVNLLNPNAQATPRSGAAGVQDLLPPIEQQDPSETKDSDRMPPK